MKTFILLLIVILLQSCTESGGSPIYQQRSPVIDTNIIKVQPQLVPDYLKELFSKTYYYYWIAGGDTLDLWVYAREYKEDHTVSISFSHDEQVPFSILIRRMQQVLPKLKEDFNLSKLRFISCESPAMYPDLAHEFSKGYKQRFGWTNVSLQKVNAFLLKTKLTTTLDEFFLPMRKKVKGYAIEKHHLMKRDGFHFDYVGLDFKDYPEYFIDGMNMTIYLSDK